jgi:hypothetical protein
LRPNLGHWKAEGMNDSGSMATNEQLDVPRPNIYVFTGRIHPERFNWNMNPPYEVIVSHHDGTSSLLQITISASQVNVVVRTNSDDAVLDMKNRVARQVRNLVDSLGFVTAASLDVEIINCTSLGGGCQVFNTAFDGLLEHPPGSEESQRIFNVLITQANRSQFVRMALADMRNAIAEPLDTCVNCYRAVESIRHEYLEGESDSGTDRKSSWMRLRNTVGVDETEIRWLEDRATPRRHGRPLDVTHAEREQALRLARRVVEEHCLARQESAPSADGIV